MYVSRGRAEFVVVEDRRMYKIRPWRGGRLPAYLRGSYAGFKDAERALISYLKNTDKFRTAIYPGCSDYARKKFEDHILKVKNAQSND